MNKLSLFLIPLFFVICAFFLSQSRGPHWLGSVTDPDYAYLFNSMSLIQGTPIAHLDHPGTPVQILGQLVIRIVGAFTPEPDLISDVLKNPEFYLNYISAFFTFLIFCSLTLLGLVVYKLTKRLGLALFLQLTPLVSLALFGEPLTKVSTEPLILLSAILFLIALNFFYYSSINRNTLLLFCLAVGLGTATKLTFFPLIVIPFLAFKPLKEKLALIFGTAFFFFLFTLPIVESYPRLWLWVKELFVHSGRNAEGAATVVDFRTFVPNILTQIIAEPIFFCVVLVEIIILALCVSKKYFNKRFYLLVGIFLAQASQIILVAKHPGASYLGPPLSITLFSILLLMDIAKELKIFNKYFNEKTAFDKILATVAIIVVLVGLSRILNFSSSLTRLRDEQLAVTNTIQNEHLGQLIIRHHRSSSQLYALKFGNTFISNNLTHYLNNIYPDTYFWDIWNMSYSGWDMQSLDFKKIADQVSNDPARKNKQIILTGTSFEDQYSTYPNYKPKINLINIYPESKKTIEKETIYIYSPNAQ